MKRHSTIRAIHARRTGLLALLASILIAGCAKTAQPLARVEPPPPTVSEATPPAPPAPPPAPRTATSAPVATLTEEELFQRKTLERINAERPLDDVFFDFDEWAIRQDARTTLQRNAAWLRRWESTRIVIEGHGDERGTTEYNLALGDRRANATREYLVNLGIAPNRILGITKGEESPVCTESRESCWQQNRRAHPIVTGK